MNPEMLKITRSEANRYREELDALGTPDVVKAVIAPIRAFVSTSTALFNSLKSDVSASFSADYMAWNGAGPNSDAL